MHLLLNKINFESMMTALSSEKVASCLQVFKPSRSGPQLAAARSRASWAYRCSLLHYMLTSKRAVGGWGGERESRNRENMRPSLARESGRRGSAA